MKTILITALLISTSAFAQKTERANVACDNKVDAKSGFTDCELLKLSSISSQMQVIQATSLQPLQQEANTFIQRVLSQNPGKTYEPPSQQFPFGRIATPPAPKAATPVPPAAPAANPAKK